MILAEGSQGEALPAKEGKGAWVCVFITEYAGTPHDGSAVATQGYGPCI